MIISSTDFGLPGNAFVNHFQADSCASPKCVLRMSAVRCFALAIMRKRRGSS